MHFFFFLNFIWLLFYPTCIFANVVFCPSCPTPPDIKTSDQGRLLVKWRITFPKSRWSQQWQISDWSWLYRTLGSAHATKLLTNVPTLTWWKLIALLSENNFLLTSGSVLLSESPVLTIRPSWTSFIHRLPALLSTSSFAAVMTPATTRGRCQTRSTSVGANKLLS